MATTASVIDEDVQSRQLLTYGLPVMQRLAGASILIIGLNGLGVEVSKNIVLANVRKVTLADDRIAAWSDLGAHFYLQPDDVGKTNRALACARSLKDVNPGVEVVCWTAAISEELLAQHHAVCVCDCVCTSEEGPISFKWNEICRNRSISFVRCEARGVFGYVFDDLASSGKGIGTFSVSDPGHEVAHISNSNPAVVTTAVLPDTKGSISGESVTITGVQGMPELNGVSAFIRDQQWDRSFGEKHLLVTLDVDTTSMGAYRSGGLMKVSPSEKLYKFASFKDAWFGGSTAQELEAMMWPLVGDLGQDDHPWGLRCEAQNNPNPHITRMLRAAFRALENHPGRKFFQGNEGEALAFVDEICCGIRQIDPRVFFCSNEYDEGNGIDDREAVIQSMRPFLTTFAMSCAGCLSPVAACVGGIAAQEIIKSIACIDDPLSQFLFCSFVDILPKPHPTFAEVAPLNTRYDSQIAVLGAPFHHELRALKVFLVGAGATGSELIKHIAMCGLGTKARDSIMVADDDIVEPSNLSRQFLYRSSDIKKKKAICAVKAAEAMNSDLKALPKAERIDQGTPSTLGANCDLTIMAVDNDKARSFLARRCQYGYRNPQPCLNLGTEGLSLCTDAIIPNVTESWLGMAGFYREPVDPVEGNVGEETTVTTEGGKPTKPKEDNPCQERAVPKTINHCVSFAKRQFELLFVGLPNKEEPCSMVRVRDWDECIVWARKLFDYCNESWVVAVKREFPNASDSIYHGRALPDVVPFDPSDELVQQFIGSAAILKAFANDEPLIDPALSGKTSASFAAIALAASSLQLSLSDDENRSRSRISAFEKDDDANFHVEFIAACANLKARMFHVTPIISTFTAKVMAGKIIPAVATSTSVAAAFTCMDIFRVALNKRSPGSVAFSSRIFNLAASNGTFSAGRHNVPRSLIVSTRAGDFQWKEWQTHFDVQSSMTLRQLVDWLRQTHHLHLNSLQYEAYPELFNESNGHDETEMDMKLHDLIERKNGPSVRSVLAKVGSINVSIILGQHEEKWMIDSKIALPSLRISLHTT